MGKVQGKPHTGAAKARTLFAKASECRRLAEIAAPEDREAYLRLARSYEALAQDPMVTELARWGKPTTCCEDQTAS